MNERGLALVMGLVVGSGAWAQRPAEEVGRFTLGAVAVPAPWRVIRLSERVPPTDYRMLTWDGVAAVEAVANASMALLARPLEVDLRRTPVLCWRWRVDAPLASADMATREGDDYAARVYLAVNLPSGIMSLATRTKLALAR